MQFEKKLSLGIGDYEMYVNLVRRTTKKISKLENTEWEYVYVLKNITDTDGHIICDGDSVDFLTEILGAFIGNQLKSEQFYGIINKAKEWGVRAQRVDDKDIVRLRLAVDNGKTYYLEKFHCRVILSKLKRILSKCIVNGLSPNSIVDDL